MGEDTQQRLLWLGTRSFPQETRRTTAGFIFRGPKELSGLLGKAP